jgi:hypothetical protein
MARLNERVDEWRGDERQQTMPCLWQLARMDETGFWEFV